jgi:hypothetical protein
MCAQNNSVKSCVNGNRSPSPTSTLRQAMNSKATHHDSNSFHVNSDVPLRQTNGVAIRSSSSSRRNAMYLQSSAAVNVKTTTQNQPYYHQPPIQQQQQHQQHQTISENWNYSKSSEANHRNNTAPPHTHRSLSPQDVILNYEDPSSRNSPVPQSNGTGKNGCLAKPPLPPAFVEGMCPVPVSGGPRPPPRTRPKSWTSSLFNAMRNNHSSVTFQCVVEEQGAVGSGSAPLPGEKQTDHRPKDASELAMPLTAASASDGQKFYSLPRFQNGASANEPSQNKLPTTKTRSRTPSPFRTIIKGLVKGEKCWLSDFLKLSFLLYK